jgi:hypothetical protein
MRNIDEIANDINEHVNVSSMLEMVCKHLKIDLVASPLYNFRDALSHYIRLYEAKDESEKTAQESSINEHLYRGLKDGYVFIVNEMRDRVDAALTKSGKKTTKEERSLRAVLHEFKKLELEIRKNSESAVIRNLTIFVENLGKLIHDTKTVFSKYQIPFDCERAMPLP